MTTTIIATPANINTQLALAVKGGVDVIQLIGTFGHFGSGYAGAPPTRVTLDCTQAILADTVIFNGQATNWNIVGGTWTGGSTYCLQLSAVHGITVRDAYFHNWGPLACAIGVMRCTDITIQNNKFAHAISDAIDLAACQRVLIDNNKFWDLTYTATGLHTDCVQMWNIINQPITSDITITNNIAVVECQGFGHYGDPAGALLGNHNVNISNNVICTKLSWAGYLVNATNCTMKDNFAITTVGETKGWQPPTWILTDSPDSRIADSGKSGNVASDNISGLPPKG